MGFLNKDQALKEKERFYEVEEDDEEEDEEEEKQTSFKGVTAKATMQNQFNVHSSNKVEDLIKTDDIQRMMREVELK